MRLRSFLTPLLPLIPSLNIRVLRTLTTTVTQQDYAIAFNGVVNAVSGTPVNLLLPYATTNKSAVAKIVILQSYQRAAHSYLRDRTRACTLYSSIKRQRPIILGKGEASQSGS